VTICVTVEAVKHPEFAARLRSARLRSGKSQERIAEEVGTSRRHWIRWERGDHLPSREFLDRIGEATGQPKSFAMFQTDDNDEEGDQVAFGDAMQRLFDRAVDAALERKLAVRT
jgi:transcriptional regulator with XRE-family HTH domain